MAGILAVGLGFVALALLHGFVADMRLIFEERGRQAAMFGDLIIRKVNPGGELADAWSGPRLTTAEQKVLDGILAGQRARVANVVRKLIITGLVTNGRTTTQFLGIGYDLDAGTALRGPRWAWDTLAGRPLHEVRRPRAVTLGWQLAHTLDCSTEAPAAYRSDGGYVPKVRAFTCKSPTIQLQTMTTSSQLNALSVDVVGLVEGGTRELAAWYLMTDLATAQILLDTTDLSTYSVAVTEGADVAALAAALVEGAARAGLAVTVQRWQDAPEGTLYRSVVGLLNAFTAIVLVGASIIAAFAVFNLLSRSVAERTREIGTLRSMGYRRWHITLLFTAEGLCIAAFGCAVGVVLAPLLSAAANAAGVTFTAGIASTPIPLRIRVSPIDYLQIAASLCGLCSVGAFLPARRASALAIARALGHP
jgi:putative ABC transport system permease protein